MTIHALWVINKAGGLVFSRSYSGGLSTSVLSVLADPMLFRPSRIDHFIDFLPRARLATVSDFYLRPL